MGAQSLGIVGAVSTHPPIPLARTAGVFASIEAIGLLVYCIALGIAALNSSGSTGATSSAPIVEILIYLIFAVGVGYIARGSFAGSRTSRPPYLLTQIFVLIIGYTLLVGDGAVVKTFGVVIGGVGLAALAVGIASIIKEDDPRMAPAVTDESANDGDEDQSLGEDGPRTSGV